MNNFFLKINFSRNVVLNLPHSNYHFRLSAAALFRLLPLETKATGWPKRLIADVIVIVDWFGERAPGSAVFTLEEIFRKVFITMMHDFLIILINLWFL